MPALDKTIENEAKHAVYLQRYAGGLSREMNPFLDELKESIRAEILQINPELWHKRRKFNATLRRIEDIQRGIYGKWTEALTEQLELFVANELEFSVDSLQDVIVPGVDITAPAIPQVWAAATTTPLIFPDSDGNVMLRGYTANWSEKYVKRVSRAITNGFTLGETNHKIVQNIIGKGKTVDKSVRAEMKTIVRTSVSHVAGTARHAIYDANNDIVIGYEWVSTLDGRTSNICKELDGKEFYNKDGGYKPKIPQHPNERSTTSPILKGEYKKVDRSGKRASNMEGGGKPVSAKETYYSLLKKQSRGYVMEVLGPTRGKLFLDGGLSSEEFGNLTTDQKFRPLTIKEMRKKDPQLFIDAGV